MTRFSDALENLMILRSISVLRFYLCRQTEFSTKTSLKVVKIITLTLFSSLFKYCILEMCGDHSKKVRCITLTRLYLTASLTLENIQSKKIFIKNGVKSWTPSKIMISSFWHICISYSIWHMTRHDY